MNLNISGIYKITNKINGKSYIGLAKNIGKRWEQHKNFTKHETSKNLYWAFQEYGIDCFTFEILKEAPVNKLAYWEKKFIQKYDTYHNGYNSSAGGEGGNTSTLSDLFDIKYKMHIYDSLTYKSNYYELSKVDKYKNKHAKKKNRFRKKVIKLTNKPEKLDRIKIRFQKKFDKLNNFINEWENKSNSIVQWNKMRKDTLVSPVKKLAERTIEELSKEYSESLISSVKLTALALERFQSNHIKYKRIRSISTWGEVKFGSDKLIFAPQGYKNTTLHYEDILTINFTITDSAYILYFNEVIKEFSWLNNKVFRASTEINYPKGNVLYFNNYEDLKAFVTVLRVKLGF